MRMQVSLKCNKCGIDIQKQKDRVDAQRRKNSNAKFYCSSECRYTNLQKRKIINCQLCKKDIIQKPCDIKNGKKKFCSKQCVFDFRRLKREEKFNYWKNNILCVDCGGQLQFLTLSGGYNANAQKEPRCKRCSVQYARVEHEQIYFDARIKIAAGVKAEYESLSPENKLKRTEGLRAVGAKAGSGNCSKLEKSIKDDLNILGFEHNQALRKVINGAAPDYINEDKKIIIEVNGDYWHCNPLKYNSDWFHPVKKKTAQQIWEIDSKRTLTLNEAGYKVIIIWERDVLKNKQEVILKIKKEII